MIAFKRLESVDEWKRLHPKMRDILVWLVSQWKGTLTITRIDSPFVEGETGIHHTDPCRAVDLRTRGMAPEFWDAKADDINAAWQYDPNRPEMRVALYHRSGKGAYHMHLQVHPRTRPTLASVGISDEPDEVGSSTDEGFNRTDSNTS